MYVLPSSNLKTVDKWIIICKTITSRGKIIRINKMKANGKSIWRTCFLYQSGKCHNNNENRDFFKTKKKKNKKKKERNRTTLNQIWNFKRGSQLYIWSSCLLTSSTSSRSVSNWRTIAPYVKVNSSAFCTTGPYVSANRFEKVSHKSQDHRSKFIRKLEKEKGILQPAGSIKLRSVGNRGNRAFHRAFSRISSGNKYIVKQRRGLLITTRSTLAKIASPDLGPTGAIAWPHWACLEMYGSYGSKSVSNSKSAGSFLNCRLWTA